MTDNSGNFSPWIRLIDPAGINQTFGIGSTSGYLAYTATVPGIYTVLVASGDSRGVGAGTYRLTLAKVP